DPGKPVEDAAWVGVREWSAGQAVQLRASMERLTWRAKNERFDKKDVWPEYSELSCFACHHSLGPAKDSWRQEHCYVGRRPGDPAWNASRYTVFRLLAKQIDSASGQELDRQLLVVSEEMSKLNLARSVVAPAGERNQTRVPGCFPRGLPGRSRWRSESPNVWPPCNTITRSLCACSSAFRMTRKISLWPMSAPLSKPPWLSIRCTLRIAKTQNRRTPPKSAPPSTASSSNSKIPRP